MPFADISRPVNSGVMPLIDDDSSVLSMIIWGASLE